MKKYLSLLLFFYTTHISFLYAQDEILNSIIKTVSPVEVSAIIKQLGIKYDRSFLNAPDKVASYQSDFKKALNLGVYSTDLGYATINEQNNDALFYLNAVKRTADGLLLGNFIDFNKILTLAANKNDLNKLLDETASTFENMSEYLDQNKKSNIAALILTGGWMETLFITCQVSKQVSNPELTSRIVEQKLILDQLLPVLRKYQSDQGIKNLVNDLTGLEKLFSKYQFMTDNGNVTVKEENGILVASSDNKTEEIKVTPQELQAITSLVLEIRSKIVN